MAHILIAEDEIGVAHLASTLCQIWGHTVTLAEHGEEALEYLGHDGCDLLLSDARMPFMDGITLAYILRKSRRHHDLPIVGLTASSDEERALFYGAGADVVLEKPYEIEALRQAIDQVLAARRRAS
ncbi:MAG: response regulator [Candidatus Sericytochromatia bacterium]